MGRLRLLLPVLATLGVLVADGPARATTGPVCFPLPPDYKVRVDVAGGSAVGAAEALACLAGLVPSRAAALQDATLTFTHPKPVPILLALADAARELKPLGIRLRVDGPRLVLEPGPKPRARRASAAPAPTPVRVSLQGFARTALVATRGQATPPRSLLREPDRVRKVEEDHFVVSVDLRRLAAEDPMAFISEGAAFPNLIAFPEPGFIVTHVRPDGLIDRLGLKSGDLVTSINGLPFRTIQDAFFAYKALLSADVLVVLLYRGFERRAIVYEIR